MMEEGGMVRRGLDDGGGWDGEEGTLMEKYELEKNEQML